MRAGISSGIGHRNSISAFENFVSAAHSLWKVLIEPIESAIKKPLSSIRIIPDGILGYVPFDVLIKELPKSEEVDYLNLNYAINYFEISYASSASLWKESLSNLENSKEVECIAYAPVYSNFEIDSKDKARENNNVNLSGTTPEIQAIAKRTKGLFLTNHEATEKNFKEKCCP